MVPSIGYVGVSGTDMRFYPRICLARRVAATALVALLAGHGGAAANDMAAAHAAGGLVFQHTDAVRMVSEVLRISPVKIEVDYEFENTTASDVTTPVAFPLPEVRMSDLSFHPVNLPILDEANFVDFKV